MVFGLKYKKGNAVLDTITIIVVLLIMAISILFGKAVLSDINADIQAETTFSAEAKAVTGDLNSNYTGLFDNLFLLALVLLTIFVLGSVFLIDTHPIFFIISIVLLLFVFVLAGILANVYNDIAEDDTISAIANEFTYMGWIMSHLLEVIMGIGFLISIVLFAKYKAG